MEYVITFADVMAGVVTVVIGILGFFARGYLKTLQNSIDNIKQQNDETKRENKEMYKALNERIEKVKGETDTDIENIKKQINDIKGDFSMTFVLREDFFRSMNGVEDRMRSIDGKIDKLLLQSRKNEV